MNVIPSEAKRSRGIRLCYLCVVAVACSSQALAAPPPDFDARVESLRKSLGVPGVSIAIVENGQTTLARGYGIRKLRQPQAVDPDTIFRTGSTGKAFTVAALAMLMDEGKIKWDDKVIDHMPDFRMYDSWVTREMTIRDLLVHRSGLGLGAGDRFSSRAVICRARKQCGGFATSNPRPVFAAATPTTTFSTWPPVNSSKK